MATKTFLTEEQLNQGIQKLSSLEGKVRLKNKDLLRLHGAELSSWVSDQLESRLKKISSWEKAHPICLGSWSRDEITACSDIDLLFVGEEVYVKQFVTESTELNLKIRYRVPKEKKDWTVGVEDFDTLAVLQASSLAFADDYLLKKQKQQILSRGSTFRKQLLTSMREERKSRNQRYNSISNYLEPNIKYGPGGLRDLQQGLYVAYLFGDKLSFASEITRQLEGYKWYFICIRHWLHLNIQSDVLLAQEQATLSKWCGYESVKEFMKELQKAISEVSFLASLLVDAAKSSQKRLQQLESVKINSLNSAFKFLYSDHSYLAQGIVRKYLAKKPSRYELLGIGKTLSKYIKVDAAEEYYSALFQSHLLMVAIPELKRVSGLVQHDQYHQYTVDAHTLMVVKKCIQGLKSPKKVFSELSYFVKGLSAFDKKVLLWTSIYHDITKGREGSHSESGAQLVRKDFKRFRFSKKFTEEVAWMVQNHLLVSGAAFRHNPQSTKTWKYLHSRGAKGRRFINLALFTVLDIQGTNPEAWTKWKERLLVDLMKASQSALISQFIKLFSKAEALKVPLSSEFIRGLDQGLVSELPVRALVGDYKQLKAGSFPLPIQIIKSGEDQYWIRFHENKDESGVFLLFVSSLYSAGCQIQQCFVQTYADYGVYDWFLIRSQKSTQQLKNIFKHLSSEVTHLPKVKFSRVVLITEDDTEVILSFRGKEKPGFLFAAAELLFNNEIMINWARANTWGRQFEVVFSIKRTPENARQIQALIK